MEKKLTLTALFIGFFTVLALYIVEGQKVLSTQPMHWQSDQKADCAVVLTGGRYRVQAGIDLLSQKRIKKLIISGVNPGAKLKEIFPQWVFYGTMEEQDVILEKQSKTTYGNAQQSLQLVEALQCADIILITSRLHMHRSLNTFRSVFPESLQIQEHSIIPGHYDFSLVEVFIEVTKSLFYSTWVY